jgi:hypothetical protein
MLLASERQVEEQRALPGLPDGLGAQLALTLGGGVRLGGQQRLVQVGGFLPVRRRPPQRGAVRALTLAEQKIVRLTLNPLTVVES